MSLSKRVGCCPSEVLLDRLNDFEFRELSEWLDDQYASHNQQTDQLKPKIIDHITEILKFGGAPFTHEMSESIARDFCTRGVKFTLNPGGEKKFEETELGRVRKQWFSLVAICEGVSDLKL